MQPGQVLCGVVVSAPTLPRRLDDPGLDMAGATFAEGCQCGKTFVNHLGCATCAGLVT